MTEAIEQARVAGAGKPIAYVASVLQRRRSEAAEAKREETRRQREFERRFPQVERSEDELKALLGPEEYERRRAHSH